MNRREFVKGSAAAAAATAALSVVPDAFARGPAPRPAAEKFKLRYAFDAGQFSNHAAGGVVDELKFAADQGFRVVWEEVVHTHILITPESSPCQLATRRARINDFSAELTTEKRTRRSRLVLLQRVGEQGANLPRRL